VPHWHAESRTLIFTGKVVKHFRRASPDVQLLLDALQAHGWVPFIDNPLPRIPGRNRKLHLHDVIQNFNRRLDRKLIQLRCSGDRVGWEILLMTPNDTHAIVDNALPARTMRRHK
jgi:hypothetical protein